MLTRRQLLCAGGAGLLSYSIAGSSIFLSPAEAREKALPLDTLSPDEVIVLEALGDAMVPGAAQAGIAWYIDRQLSVAPEECLLMLRYLGPPAPYINFYRPCLGAVETACKKEYSSNFSELGEAHSEAFISRISQGNPAGWQGPPAPFFYFVLRSDAIDVVYGTQSGFKELDIPYMAHITPPSDW